MPPTPERDDRFSRSAIAGALKRWHQLEELGEHPLAQLGTITARRSEDGLPDTPKGRGLALQRVLRELIDALKPDSATAPAGDAPDYTDEPWQPYIILTEALIEDRSRDFLADSLGLSRREYFRRQGQAVDALADRLWELEQAHGVVTPAVPGDIPRIDHFVGRADDLAYYRARLERERLAVITGLAGAGKTALGAELAAAQAQRGPIFWLTFRHGINTDVDAVLQDIALFLRSHGQEAFWDFLQAEAEAGTRHPLHSKINHLVGALETGRYTLCFDSYELVDDDPEITSLFQILREKAAPGGTLALIVIGRQKPNFAVDLDVRPLAGLTADDARRLLDEAGLERLPAPLFQRVYAATEGNPMLLQLFSAWVVENRLADFETQADIDAVTRFVEGMWREPDIEQYLLVRVSRALTPEERQVLQMAAAFRQAFDDRHQAIIDIFAAADIPRPLSVLRGLVRKHILTRLAGSREIDCHALIRSYFYDRLREQPALKREIHARLGEYYADFQADVLEAAYHYREATEYDHAVRLLDAQRDPLLGAGRAQRLLEVLAPIRPRQVEPATWATVAALKGQARAFLGDFDAALSDFEVAVAAFETLPLTADQRRRTAGLARRIGRLYGWRGEYERAHTHMQRGLQLLDESAAAPASDADRATAALIHTHTGSLHFLQGEHGAAKEACRQALSLLAGVPEGDVHAETYKVLGVLHDVTGDWEQAMDYAQRSLRIWEELGNRHRMAEVRDNLGTLHLFRGEFGAAQALYEENLAFWGRVGARDKAGYARLNLGLVHLYRGRWDRAEAYFRQALVAWRQAGNRVWAALARNNLGLLELAREDYAAAREYFTQSVEEDPGAENYRGLGEAVLGLGHLDQALEYAEQSLALAREAGTPFEEGVTLRTLGRIRRALGDLERGRRHLEESLAILEGLGARYEVGRTLHELAVLEVEAGERGPAQAYLDRAIAIFEDVDAAEDLERARADGGSTDREAD